MGWRGILRDIQAASRRAEREAYRRRRALEERRRYLDRMEEYERVAYEVELYNNQIELLVSVHKACGTGHNCATEASRSSPYRQPVTTSYTRTTFAGARCG